MVLAVEELEQLSGLWIAEDDHGNVIAKARTIADLEDALFKAGFKEADLPPIRHIGVDGRQGSYLL